MTKIRTGTPPSSAAPSTPSARAEASRGPRSPRRRLLNILSRHPDLTEGRLGQVLQIACKEVAGVVDCARVALWQGRSEGDGELVEVGFNGVPVEELPPRRMSASAHPAFFAKLERRRILGPADLAGLGPEALEAGLAFVVLVRGEVWGLITFEGPRRGPLGELDEDYGLLVAEMFGRALERSGQRRMERERERAEGALAAIGRLVDHAACFELTEGALRFQGDPRWLLGAPERGTTYTWPALQERIRPAERELLERRYRGWVRAGTPGVLAMRFHFAVGAGVERFGKGDEVELVCRLTSEGDAKGGTEPGMADGARSLWGMVRRAGPG